MNAKQEQGEEDFDFLYKVVVVGDASVGKTNLITRFTRDEFRSDNKTTIGVEFSAKSLQIDGHVVRAQFWDTAGQERFRAMSSLYYRGARAVVIVYDITRRETFDNVHSWLSEVRAHCKEDAAFVMLLANKTDRESER